LRTKLGLLGIDSEPNCTRRIPRVDVLAIWNLGKVGLEGTGVVCVGIDIDFYAGSCGHGDSLVTWLQLVASDVAARHVSNEAIVLPVLGLADGAPGGGSVDGGEGI
jgi:hypothetical protein